MECITTQNTLDLMKKSLLRKYACLVHSVFCSALLDTSSGSLVCYVDHILFSDVDMAIENFKVVRKLDPYRLDNMDTYSYALYVKV